VSVVGPDLSSPTVWSVRETGGGVGAPEAVVAVEGLLLLRAERAVGVDPGGGLDGVLGVADDDVVAVEAGVLDRDEGLGGTEEARLDGHPVRGAGGVVDVDLADGADLVAVVGHDLAVAVEALQLLGGDAHGEAFRLVVLMDLM
jgi:hypothetical protein